MSSTNWLIGISGNWDTGGYWSSGLPNSTSNVTISAFGNYTISLDTAATINSLTMDQFGATLAESSSGVLNITNGLSMQNGTAILDGTNDITGGITMSYSGMLEIGSTAGLGGGSLITFNNGELLALNTATVSGGFTVAAQSYIAAATGATLTMNGTDTIDDGATLNFGDYTNDNNGTVILTTETGWTFPTNEYNVNVLSGTLRADADGVFTDLLANASGTSVSASAALDLYGYNTTINDLTGIGTVESSHTADLPPRLTLFTAASDEFDGQIVGRIAVAITGAITLTGDNAYTGGTTINSGSNLILGGFSGTITGNVTNEGELTSEVAGTTTLSGNISGRGSFIQNGGGTTTLSGTNSFTGGVTIDQGTLAITQGAALGTGTVTILGGELVATESTTLTDALVMGNATNFAISAASGQTLTIDPTGGWNMEGGFLTFGDGTNTNTGTVVWDTPAGSSVSPGFYSVEVQNCTLMAGTKSLSTLLQTTSTETVLDNGTVDLAGFTTNMYLLQGFGYVENSHTNIVSLNLMEGDLQGVISGNIALNIDSNGSFILDGASTYTGGTTIQTGGVMSLGDGTNNGSITGNVVDQGSLVFANSDVEDFTDRISGAGAVLQLGPGTTILDHANTFTGGVTVGNGIAEIYAGSGLGTGLLTMQTGELLGAAAPGGGAATINVTNAMTMSGVIDFSAATGDTLAMKGVWAATDNPDRLNAFNFGDGTNDGTVVWYTPTSSSDVASNFTVTVESGTLKAGDGNLGQLLALDTTTTVDAGATLNFAGFSTALDGLEGAGSVVSSGTNAITVNLTNGDFTGTIVGSMTFDMYGQVTLDGANKFTLANIENNADLILGGTQKENVSFLVGGTTSELALQSGAKLMGTLSGFGSGDTIDLQGVTYGSGTTFTYNATTGVLSVTDGTHTETVTMGGTYVPGNFVLGADSGTGTDITFDPTPAVLHKADTFDFSQVSTAPAPQPMAEFEPESQTSTLHAAQSTIEHSSQVLSDLIEHLVSSHHAPASYDFAFA